MQNQMAGMVARAQRMLDQAQRQPGTAAARFIGQMRRAAKQDNGAVADMSPFMASGTGAGKQSRPRLPGDPDYVPVPPPAAAPASLINGAVAGRRITTGGGNKANWLFVDSWYTLGPFPNPARQNLNTPFGPETVIDLDATYPGKGGRTLRWRFLQANSPNIIPHEAEEYGVYYAYTELYLDEARDLWVAIGSDDKSTLWVEDQIVWMSSDQLKGWNVSEGLRRVHFQKGRNRILLRCENGWYGVAFSLVIGMNP